jgi:hypothetical protein
MSARSSTYIRLLTFLICVALGLVGRFGHWRVRANADIRKALAPHAASETKLAFDESEIYGRYYFGDGLGVNCSLTIEEDHRFSFQWRGCEGVYDQNSGTWQLHGDVVTLKLELPNKREGGRGLNIRYVPIKWGERHYLVDENEMPGFCVKAHSGTLDLAGILLLGNDYVKWPGQKLPSVQGIPVIPERYKTFYENGEVSARVVQMTANRNVILDKGAADRINPNMLFALAGQDDIDLKIVSVTEHQSVAQALYYWSSDRYVKVGDLFTTGTTWTRPHGTGYKQLNKPPEVRKTSK